MKNEIKPLHDKTSKMTLAPNEDSDQPGRAWASAQSEQSLRRLHEETLGSQLSIECTAKTLIRLGGCPGWTESSLGTKAILLILLWGGSNGQCLINSGLWEKSFARNAYSEIPIWLLFEEIYHCQRQLSHLMTKPTKWHMRPTKTQISLGIRPVWSESSLCAQLVAKDPSFLHADSEDSDQTGRMHMLFCWFWCEAAQLLYLLQLLVQMWTLQWIKTVKICFLFRSKSNIKCLH